MSGSDPTAAFLRVSKYSSSLKEQLEKEQLQAKEALRAGDIPYQCLGEHLGWAWRECAVEGVAGMSQASTLSEGLG